MVKTEFESFRQIALKYAPKKSVRKVVDKLHRLGGKASFHQLEGKGTSDYINPKLLSEALKILTKDGIVKPTVEIIDNKPRIMYTLILPEFKRAISGVEKPLIEFMGDIYTKVSETPKGSPKRIKALVKAVKETLTLFNLYTLQTIKLSIQSETEEQAVRRYLTLMDSGIIALTGNLMWILWENKHEALTLLDSILSEKESS
jgi:DNA-binding HxlR family transcriptional regulator